MRAGQPLGHSTTQVFSPRDEAEGIYLLPADAAGQPLGHSTTQVFSPRDKAEGIYLLPASRAGRPQHQSRGFCTRLWTGSSGLKKPMARAISGTRHRYVWPILVAPAVPAARRVGILSPARGPGRRAIPA